jgi:hypothetical protein
MVFQRSSACVCVCARVSLCVCDIQVCLGCSEPFLFHLYEKESLKFLQKSSAWNLVGLFLINRYNWDKLTSYEH